MPSIGGLAQLARALAWHARGHRFDSDILHKTKPNLLLFWRLRFFNYMYLYNCYNLIFTNKGLLNSEHIFRLHQIRYLRYFLLSTYENLYAQKYKE